MKQLWEFLNDEEDARVCLDIPEEACDEQPLSFALQLAAKSLSTLADTLSSSRVVLPWLLGAIAAPAAFIAWLVPLRESLSLLPQLVVAAQMRKQPMRRGFYAAGALAQGCCLLAMPLVLLLPSATVSAAALLLLLGLFSLARGVCSVAAKDVLGKTISKKRRGRLTGVAGSVAGVFTISLALGLFFGGGVSGGDTPLALLVAMLVAAGLCWFVVAVLYRRIPEVPGATGGGGNALDVALSSIGLLGSDVPFRRFVIARALLVSSAFTIPYLVVATQSAGNSAMVALAAILLAEGLASLSSSTIWGFWSDRSSARVMAAASTLTAITLAATLVILHQTSGLLGNPLVSGSLLYCAAVAHQGARVGRKTYLVDLATQDKRAGYVAVSNTVIGLLMLLGGGFGFIDARFGISAVLGGLLAMSVLSVIAALWLPGTDD